MKKVLVGLISVLFLASLVLAGCQKSQTDRVLLPVAQSSAPSSTPASPSRATQVSEKPISTAKQKGIEGSVFIAPEAKGKLEILSYKLTDSYLAYGGTPEIRVELKNVSDQPITLSNDKNGMGWTIYNEFYIHVISMDAAGKQLDNEDILYSKTLKPKEVKTEEVRLFSSDETKKYEIRLGYNPLPKVTGNVIKSSEAEGMLEITSHSLNPSEYGWGLWLQVKNASGKQLYNGWKSEGEVWYAEVTYLGASGNAIKTVELEIAGKRDALAPEGVKKIGDYPLPSETASYTIRIIKRVEKP